MMITEAVELSYDMMKEAVVQNAKKLSSDFEIVSEEFRNVNGTKILCLTSRASRSGVGFMFLYYIYTGTEGTTQLICYTSANIFNKLKPQFEDLMNGFVLVK
jgi:hypothetical protein